MGAGKGDNASQLESWGHICTCMYRRIKWCTWYYSHSTNCCYSRQSEPNRVDTTKYAPNELVFTHFTSSIITNNHHECTWLKRFVGLFKQGASCSPCDYTPQANKLYLILLKHTLMPCKQKKVSHPVSIPTNAWLCDWNNMTLATYLTDCFLANVRQLGTKECGQGTPNLSAAYE